MTKSITGLLAQMLVAEGMLDDRLRVRDIDPEIGNSAFASATPGQVMDMTTRSIAGRSVPTCWYGP